MVAVGLDGMALLNEPNRARLAIHQAVLRKAEEIQADYRQDLANRISNAVLSNIKVK